MDTSNEQTSTEQDAHGLGSTFCRRPLKTKHIDRHKKSSIRSAS